MFIITETISFNDPLKSSENVTFFDHYSFGHFEVAEVKDAHVADFDFTPFVHRIVDENIARAAKFGKADHKDRLGIVAGSGIHEELIHASLEEHAYKPKVYYTLTEQDIADQIAFWKTIMEMELEFHYKNVLTPEEAERNSAYKQSIANEITACQTALECRKLMHTKFGFATGHKLPAQEEWGDTTTALHE